MEPLSRKVEKLTPIEQKFLQSSIIGYRNLKETSEKCGVPRRTLHNISKNGHGSETYVRILRNTLLSRFNQSKVENISENQNVAA